jgi:hypothetical protein
MMGRCDSTAAYIRHAELVSASIGPQAQLLQAAARLRRPYSEISVRAEKWTLSRKASAAKQVQDDVLLRELA